MRLSVISVLTFILLAFNQKPVWADNLNQCLSGLEALYEIANNDPRLNPKPIKDLQGLVQFSSNEKSGEINATKEEDIKYCNQYSYLDKETTHLLKEIVHNKKLDLVNEIQDCLIMHIIIGHIGERNSIIDKKTLQVWTFDYGRRMGRHFQLAGKMYKIHSNNNPGAFFESAQEKASQQLAAIKTKSALTDIMDNGVVSCAVSGISTDNPIMAKIALAINRE